MPFLVYLLDFSKLGIKLKVLSINLKRYGKVSIFSKYHELICCQNVWAFNWEIMKYQFLHERKSSPSSVQWYVYVYLFFFNFDSN